MKTRSVFLGMLLAVAAATPAAADSSHWTATRVLDCGTAGILQTVLNPAGFGTPYHLLNGTGQLVPRRVTVEGILVFSRPGSQHDANTELTCSYTDPMGLSVVVEGLVTGGI